MKLTKKIEAHTWREILAAADIGDSEIICDKCHEPILCEKGEFPGVIILGNIYAANKDFAHNLCGIIGNNFPHWSDDGQPEVTVETLGTEFKLSWLEVKANAYHVTCLTELLMEPFNEEYPPCPQNCGGRMIMSGDHIHHHCNKCGYDKRMED
jgi:ribosomal protein S27AE